MSCGDNPFGVGLLGSGDRHGLSAVPDVPVAVPPQNAEREPGSQEPERQTPERETGTETSVVLASVLPGTERSAAERSLASLKRWVKQMLTRNPYKRGLASMVTSRLHKMYAGQPGSLDSHWAHVKAAAWFPEELEGSWLKWVRFAWRAFGFTWCRFLKILGNTIGSAGDHARTAFVLLVIVIVLVIYFG